MFTGRHAYRLRRRRVEELAEQARAAVVFLGTVDNEREVWDLFDRVVCLVIDDPTLRHRLSSRTTNMFGREPHELEAVLTWHKDHEQIYRRLGASIVDATQPLPDVVAAVIEMAIASHPEP